MLCFSLSNKNTASLLNNKLTFEVFASHSIRILNHLSLSLSLIYHHHHHHQLHHRLLLLFSFNLLISKILNVFANFKKAYDSLSVAAFVYSQNCSLLATKYIIR